LTPQPREDEQEHENDKRNDHTKTKTNKKMMNEMPTQRQTRKRNNKQDAHAKMTQSHRNSTQQHQIIEQIMAPASSQRVLANQGDCQTTKDANAT